MENDQLIFSSKHAASLVERKAWIAVELFAVICIAQIDQEIGTQSTIWEKLGVDLGKVHTAHGSAV